MKINERGFQEVGKKFKYSDDTTIIPTRGSRYSAGYDLHSKDDVIIPPGEHYKFFTDVKSYMKSDEVLQIFIRSSIGIKKEMSIMNNTGIIDPDYYNNQNNDGNIIICLKNNSQKNVKINDKERIAQGIFFKFLEASEGNSSKHRSGGIGSTND